MGRSQQTFRKKEIQNKKEKKRKDKEQKRLTKKDKKTNSLDDMIAYVDENGMLSSTPPDPNEKEETIAEDIEIGIPKKEDIEEDPFHYGRLVFFNDAKGYGFIKDKDRDDKYFVHINNMIDEIRENDLVQFELEKGPKGLVAVRVQLSK